MFLPSTFGGSSSRYQHISADFVDDATIVGITPLGWLCKWDVGTGECQAHVAPDTNASCPAESEKVTVVSGAVILTDAKSGSLRGYRLNKLSPVADLIVRDRRQVILRDDWEESELVALDVMTGALTRVKTRDETVAYWFDDELTPSELNNEDESHQLPFSVQDVTRIDGRYVLITTRISQDEYDPTYVEWLDPCTGGLLAQRFVAGYADGRFRPEHPDELIVAYPHHRSSPLEIVKIDNSFKSPNRFFEKQVEVVGGLVNGSVRCSPDGEFLAFVRCQSDSGATVQIRTCDSLEVCWERPCPISRCDQHDLMKLNFSKSFSHIALTDFANVWVRPIV